MAAVLAGGRRAVLSHRSAGALWGLLRWEGTIDLTIPSKRHRRPGLAFHAADLPADETTSRAGIPTTTVPRTLLDLAAVLSRPRLERAVGQAEVLRLTDALGVPVLLDRHPGRRGTAALWQLIGATTATVTRGELEARFLAFAERAGLPRPSTNVAIEGFEVDCAWLGRRLVVELDGHASHATRRAFEQDRERDRVLTAAGWRVVRVTWRQLHLDAAAVTADLRRLVLG